MPLSSLSLLLLSFILVRSNEAKTFENQVVGKPYVSCQNEAIGMVATVEEYFEGQIYVKGASKNEKCVRQYDTNQNATEIELRIDPQHLISCGFTVYPKPNSNTILISGHIVISFHRELVTPTDRAFAIHCELDNNQHTTNIEVNQLNVSKHLVNGEFNEIEVRMSVFGAGEESVEKNSTDLLKEIEVVNVGDPIIFKWELMEKHGIFGIQLERCNAETNDGKGMKIIERGCSLDDEIISDSSTSPDFTSIYANSLAFKFPEEHSVFIRCSVRLCVKRSEHLEIIGGSNDDLCEIDNYCGIGEQNEENQRKRRQLNNSTRLDLIHVSGKFQIEKSRKYEKLRSTPTASSFCMSGNVYYVGISSITIIYILTLSTTIVYKFRSS